MKKQSGVTGTALAAHLDCTRETISDYLARGMIKKLKNGRYDQDVSRNSVLKHLRDKAAGRSGANPGGPDLSTERALLAKEQREGISLKNAISKGEYVLVRLVTIALERIFSIIREHILTREGRLADALTMRTREEAALIIHNDSIGTLNELRLPTTYGPELVDGLDEDGGHVHAATGPKSDRLGGHLQAGIK